jgi:hypothetical protein
MSVQFSGAIREFNDAIINIIFKKNTVLINCKENFCNLIDCKQVLVDFCGNLKILKYAYFY